MSKVSLKEQLNPLNLLNLLPTVSRKIKELEHLLKVAEDKIVIKDNTIAHLKEIKSDEFLMDKIIKLQEEIDTLRGLVGNIDIENLSNDWESVK